MRIIKENKPSGSGGGVPVEPSWPFFKQLQFLEPFLKHRATTSNFNRPVTSVSPSQEMTFTTVQEDSSLNVADEDLGSQSQQASPECQPAPSFLSFHQRKSSTFSTPLPPSLPTEMDEAGPSKKPRRSEVNGNNDILLKVIQVTNEFTEATSNRQEPDEDDLFGQCIGKQLKKLNEFQKSLAKIKIQQVIHEIQWQNNNN